MKPTHGDVTSSQSCSCTSCTYKSKSERPSLKQIVSRGSKVDKLFLGNYIPPRERKLIDKLVRTRAFYDDIRNQLVSESSISEKADLRPKKNMPRRDKEIVDAERKSAILELVNLVDKGAALGPRRLSECCSCCGCGSITQHEHQGRGHTHRHGWPHLSSLSSMASARRAKDERRKGRLHKARLISSDPCTCTAKFSGLLKTESKSLIKKLRGKKSSLAHKPLFENFEENGMRTNRKVKGLKFKQAGMGESVRRSLTKVKQSSTRISRKVKTGSKKSLETIQKTQHKVKGKIKDSARKTVDKLKPVKQQKEMPSDDDIVADAIKDSLTIYKEGLLFDPSFWECKFECDPEDCEPEECYKKKHKILKNIDAGIAESSEIIEALNKADSEIQSVKNETVSEKETIKNNAAEKNDEMDNRIDIRNEIKKKAKKKNAQLQDNCSCKSAVSKTSVKTKSTKSNTSVLQNTEAKIKQIKNSLPSTPSTKAKERQALKKGSAFGFSIEIYKEKPTRSTNLEEKKLGKGLDIKSGHQSHRRSSKTSQSTRKKNQSGGLALKRCFCTLKLKPNKNKSNMNTMQQTTKSRQAPVLLPYECEPMVCVPGKCDPVECLKLIQKRGLHHSTMTTNNTNYNTKSTPSLTSKSVSSGSSQNLLQETTKGDNTRPSQQINARPSEQSEQLGSKPARQAVRISSNFSFNIEFYKDKGDHMNSNLTSMANKETSKKQVSHLTHQPSQISSSGKSKYTLTKHKLRRCFCTLKFAKAGQKRYKIQSHSRGTLTSAGHSITTPAPVVVDKATEKRERKNIIKYTLLPYECEPGICVPGECNPYRCLEIIKRRKTKTHTRQVGSDQRMTKSTYSITRRKPITSVKSITSRQNNEKGTTKRRRVHRETTSLSGVPHKQAIRIGSSFSFNVEFYKEKTSPLRETPIYQVEPKNVGIKTTIRSKKSQGHTFMKQQKSSAVQSANKKKEALTQSNMKRCFCTLKLHKIAKRKNQVSTTGTDAAIIKEEMYPKIITATKSTKMKKMPYVRQLEPYECEPNFCSPGQCDPNICLERIKVRDKVKSRKFGTLTNTLKTISVSSTSDTYKKSKDAMSQSFQKPKQIKRNNYTPSVNNSEASTERYKSTSRQATRIGSNFSFNIEFSKDISLKTHDIKETENVRPKVLKHRGAHFGGEYAKSNHSQTSDIKKLTKSTGLRPILEKCFCTRKLQKNIKILPTVMPVLVQNSFTTFYKEEWIRLRNLLSKQILKNYASSTSTMFSSSYTESSLSTAHKDFKKYQQRRINKYSLLISSTSLITKLNKETVIGMNRYLKSSFYAMNLQVQNKQKYKHKLEPYECVPGICIPGQCDPVECQKLIMKRLMKKVSTMTSTKRRSQAVSSGALHSKSRKQQYNKAPTANAKPKIEKEQGIKYKTLPRSHKQAVRVGSSFSFNIEFFKDRTTTKQPPQEIIGRVKRDKGETSSTNTNFKKRESRSTSGTQVLQQHRTSQSGTAMHDKGFNVTPKLKRCFCTLKIQKKGRQSKAFEDKNMTKKVEKKIDIVKTADTGQNTKKIKPYLLPDLDPNECEPNICVPGECDPYKCLEIIKKRGQRRNTKDFGTDMKPRKMTTSSMTSSQKQATKAKQAHIQEKTTKPAIIKPVAPIQIQYTKPSRQVVRIGSNFSFDIEFFKDKSYPGEVNIPTIIPSKAIEHKQMKSQKAGKDKNLKQISIQDSKSMRHQDSQVGLPAQCEKSTKTGSLIQRCFCTQNLHKQTKSHKNEKSRTVNNFTRNQTRSPSFLERCFCTLKSLATVKQKKKVAKTAAPAEPQKVETSSSVQTKKVKEKRQVRKIVSLKLDPNECEPGVCVPGECDPLICIERIRKRNGLDKMSSTEASGTRSTSTLLKSPKVSKSTASNAYTPNKKKTTKPKVKPRSQSEKRTKSPEQRSAVRIGSNFNFSVEFYKEKIPTYQQVQSAVKEIKQSRVAATESSKLISAQAKGIDNPVLLLNRDSQVDHIKKKDKASDVGMLKRCFCTLALQKHPVTPMDGVHPAKGKNIIKIKKSKNVKQKVIKQDEAKMEMSTKGTETPDKRIKKLREHKTKPYKLEPYECEPGICVPDKCNPYECEKLIKRRQRRESSTETLQQTFKSVTTITNTDAKKNHKVQNVQALNRYKRSTASKQHAPVKRVSISSKGHAKQAVKIGSNFSFNIEFSKSKTENVSKINEFISEPVQKRTHNDTQSQSANYRHQKTQRKRDVHHAYSQVLAKKVRSTVTEVAPLLKRCFCTLKLKNEKLTKEKVKVVEPIPKNIKPTKPITSHVDKVINTDKPKHKPLRTLDPNECEPGTCIPGKCNPHECLKRIQKRMRSKMSNTDAVSGQKTSSTTSKPEYSTAKTTTGINRRLPASREAGDYQKPEKRRPSQSPTTIQQGNRQVVRIGSNFSFNIEFFKDTSDNNGMISTKPERIPKISQQKIQSDSHSQSNAASGGFQRKLVDRQLQSLGLATESKGSGVGPLMKRCFCTLKLQKVGKIHQKIPEPVNKMKDNAATARLKVKVQDSAISRNVGTKTKKKHQVLEPYECEPNTCIPGQCNPLECLKRIKLRNLNEFGTDAMRTSMKSTSSLTDGRGQPKTIQTPLQKTAVTKSTYKESKRKPERVSYSHTAENRNRQSVRLGSSFNFDIEFFKESSQNKEPVNNVKYETPSMIDTHKKLKTRPIRTKSQGSFNQSLSSQHRGQQARVLQESVGSGITPLLKRCFCTLTLHNTEKNKIPCPKSRKYSVSSQNKSTSTKKLKELKLNIPDDLDPNECEPGVCIPGQCNPYECLDRIKKRGIRRQSRTTSPNQRRCHNKACAAFESNGHSKQIQSEDTKIQRIVEQPRFSFMDRNNWQGMKIGSNISFNIEFYKETVLPDANAIDSAKTHNSKLNNKSMRQSMVSNETTDAKNMRNRVRLQNVETEDKKSIARNAGEALRKYFCSSRCQQNKLCEKCLTVGRIEKIITQSPFKPSQYYIYQVKQIRHACSDDFVEIEMKTVPQTKKQVPKDNIKTILPYKPRKYLKNGSNTLFSRKCIAKGAENYCCSNRAYQGQRCKEGIGFDIIKLPYREISKHIRLTCKEDTMILPHKSTVKALKKFFCTQFTKCRYETVKQMDPDNRDIISLQSNSAQLKKCKSDRSPVKCPLTEPKKSKSCKTTVRHKTKYNMQQQCKKCFSRLQCGDAMFSKIISVSEKNLNNNYQKCSAEEPIYNNKYCETAIDNTKCGKCKMTQSNHFKKTAYSPLPVQNKTPLSVHQPGILIECARKLSKCKEKIFEPQVSNYKKSCYVYVCKMEHQHLKDTVLTKQLKESKKIKGDELVRTRAVIKNIENPCVCEGLVKKNNDFKLKATGQKLTKEKICVCDTICACAKNLKKINNNDTTKNSEQTKKFKAEPWQGKQQVHIKKYNKTTPKLTQHCKLCKEDIVAKQQKIKLMNVTKNKNKYRGNSLQQAAASVLSFAKLGTAVDDVMRSTKNKLKDDPATNNLINKYHPKDKKKFKEPSDFGCSLYSLAKLSLRKKPWLAIYYNCCPWFFSNFWRRKKKEVH